jgi:hypothetical protein
MKKTTLRPLQRLSLDRETLRSLTIDDLATAAGGLPKKTDDCLMCPEKTWSGSQSRTILY